MSSVASEASFFRPAAGKLACRFLWKESRRLLGLTLGVAGISVAVMLLLWAFGPDRELPERLLVVAFGGAAMMAVAAAVTLFSVEEEEGTALLLRTLPRHPFAGPLGKVVAAVVVVAIVAPGLCLAAWGIAGSLPERSAPTWSQGPLIVAEAFVWALLASLLVKNPLVAAVLGMAATSFSIGAVAGATLSESVVSSQRLGEATPTRGAIVALLLIINCWLATRWFGIQEDRRPPVDTRDASPEMKRSWWGKAAVVVGLVAPFPIKLFASISLLIAGSSLSPWDVFALAVLLIPAMAGVVVAIHWRVADARKQAPSRSARVAFLRLLWQSLRQSWGVSLAVLVGGAFLSVAYAFVFQLFIGWESSWTWACVLGGLFPPALLGAAVFRADQRGEHYRFLAEHAGRPRLLWLARLLAGVAPIALFAVLFWQAAVWSGLAALGSNSYSPRWWAGQSAGWVEIIGNQMLVEQGTRMALYSGWLVMLAVLTAFAWGQLFSLVLRSDIFAGMLAMLASVIVAAWAMGVGAWRLSPTWFLGPLAIGPLAATWLRAPDWMFGRRGLVRWVAPVLAFALPIAGAVCSIPAARQAQLAAVPLESRSSSSFTVPVGATEVGARLAKLEALCGDKLLDDDQVVSFTTFARRAETQQQEGRDVAEAYERLAQNVEQAEGMTEEQFAEFDELTRKKCRLPVEFSRQGARRKVVARLIREALENPKLIGGEDIDPLGLEGREGQISLNQRLQRLLACRRVAVQQGNGMQAFAYGGTGNRWLLGNELLAWATAKEQTPERLLQAVRELEAIEDLRVGASGMLMNRYLLARSVVRGEEAPSFLQATDERQAAPTSEEWLIFLANQLPGEAERAERALGTLALFRASYLQQQELRLTRGADWWGDALRERRRFGPLSGRIHPAAMIAVSEQHDGWLQPKLAWYQHAETSYLARREFGNEWQIGQLQREWAQAYMWRKAERVRLALLAYRFEKGEYPETLDQLTPAFMQPEQYRDAGSDEPLGYLREGFDAPTHSREIRAGTPLLWSGGSIAAQPTKALAHQEATPDGVSREVFITPGQEAPSDAAVYPVMQLDTGWHTGAFWMPLPR